MTHYLIMGRNYVGDAIMSQPLIAILKSNNPVCKVTVIAGGAGFLTYQTIKEVDEVIQFTWKKKSLQLKECYRFAQQLKKEKRKYDVAIILNNSIKSVLIPFFLNIEKRLGYLGEMRYGLLTDYLKNIPKKDIKQLPIIDYYYQLLSLLPSLKLSTNIERTHNQKTSINLTPKLNFAFIEEKIQKFKLINNSPINDSLIDYFINKPFIVIAPGAATSEAKKYPTVQFITFIKKFNQKYPTMPIVLLGSKEDEIIGTKIKTGVEIAIKTETKNQENIQIIDLINKISLPVAFYVIAKSNMVIANDSGLLHVAGALNKKCLGIYGPTAVAFASPRNESFIAIEHIDLKCRPCYKATCLFSENSEDYLKCMRLLTPELLLEQIQVSKMCCEQQHLI